LGNAEASALIQLVVNELKRNAGPATG